MDNALHSRSPEHADANPAVVDPAPRRNGAAAPEAASARRDIPALGLAVALILGIAAWNFAFIAADRADFGVKDANHFMDLAREIATRLNNGFAWKDFSFDPDSSSYARLYLPTNWILGALAMRMTAISPLTLRLYSACFLPLALVYVFLLARRFCGPRAALLAVFIGGANSLTLESSRFFTLDAPLSLPLAAALFHGAQSKGFSRLWPSAAAIAWALFGMAVKPQFLAMILPPFALMAVAGWFELARGRRWKRLAGTWGWQVALAAMAMGGLYALKPNLFHLAANAGAVLRQETYSFTILNAPGKDQPPFGAGIAYWLLGLIWTMRRMAWPLVLLFLSGIVVAPFRIRGAHDKAAFLGIPLSMACMNLLLVWAGVHLETERYMGPMFVLFGIPAVAAVGAIRRLRLRFALLGGLAVFAAINTFGPWLAPYAFDSPPHALFSSLRFDGFVRKNHPLINVKLWDEPPIRPQRNPSTERIAEAVAAAANLRSGRETSPLRVAVVASSYYGNDSAPAYSWLNSAEADFLEAKRSEDLFGADLVLLTVPASPGGVGFSPSRTVIDMDPEEYQSIVIALEAPALRERLGLKEIDRVGLPNGRTLTIFRRADAPAAQAALDAAILWFEMSVTQNSIAERLERAAQWLETQGFFESAAELKDASTASAESDGAPASANPALRRLRAWLRAMGDQTPPENKESALRDALGSLPPGPGMVLASAVEDLRFRRVQAAGDFIKSNTRTYPLHLRTWATIPSLVQYGLDIPQPLAQRGEALAREALEESRLLRDILEKTWEMSKAGYPQFWERKESLLNLLHKDQPRDLRALQLDATIRFIQEDDGPDEMRLLKTAIGLAGQPFTEEPDEEMRAMLKTARTKAARDAN